LGPAIQEDRLIETLKKLIAYPSPQPEMDRVRGFIQEAVRSEIKAEALGQVFCDPGGSLGWWLPGDGAGGKPLVFCAYAGNFPAESMPDPYTPKEVDGSSYGQRGSCMWGRGPCEQIGALAAAVEAVRSFIADTPQGLKRPLLFLVSMAGETGSHEAVTAFFEEAGQASAIVPGDAVIVMGTGNEVCLGNKGRVDVAVEITGRSCHSSTPHLGINALEAATTCVSRLKDVRMPPPDPDLGPVTLVATKAETFPKASHTIPERAELMLDRRLLPGEEPGPAVEGIREALGDVSPSGLNVQGGKFQYANKVKADASLPSAAQRAVLGRRKASNPYYMNAALDAGYFCVRGHEAICLGPGDMALAHTDAEMVSVGDVIDGAWIYLEILQGLLV
jgi:acetylornithine deacetylase/succinyl-diaminopimelate desuccinylase-like protein